MAAATWARPDARRLAKVAAIELARDNVRIDALSPGATGTPRIRHQREEMEMAGFKTANSIMDRMGVMCRMARGDGGWTAMSGLPRRPVASR